MKSTWWKSGTWNAICDQCGFKFKANELKKRWDGLMVCPMDWEIRHPQELIRPVPDQTKLPWTRPDAATFKANTQVGSQDPVINSTDTFVAPVCTPWSLQGLADYAGADCATADFDLGYRHITDITHSA